MQDVRGVIQKGHVESDKKVKGTDDPNSVKNRLKGHRRSVECEIRDLTAQILENVGWEVSCRRDLEAITVLPWNEGLPVLRTDGLQFRFKVWPGATGRDPRIAVNMYSEDASYADMDPAHRLKFRLGVPSEVLAERVASWIDGVLESGETFVADGQEATLEEHRRAERV